MPIPAFKLCTYWGASQAEMERRTLTPEDEAILGARWNRAQIHHDARKEEDRIKRDLAAQYICREFFGPGVTHNR